MKFEPATLPGVFIVGPRRFADARGYFEETWSHRAFGALAPGVTFVQDNHSHSSSVGTIRGLHFQRPPFAQDKLVRVVRGAILDVAVDIRPGSPTFGHWVGVELSAQNGRQLFIPKDFLHGFVTRAPDTEVVYKCSAYYAPDFDGCVRFDDPDIGVDWGIPPHEATLSHKDAGAPRLRDIVSPSCGGAP